MPFDGPLTEEQRRFAEQNHNLVYKFLHQHGLSIDEYYDIVIHNGASSSPPAPGHPV